MSEAANIKPANSYTSCSLNEPVLLRIGNEGLPTTKPQTIPELFKECCTKFKDLPALAYQLPTETSNSVSSETTDSSSNATIKISISTNIISNAWHTVTYSEYYQNVEKLSLILLHLNVEAHSCVSVLAFNCPEWFYISLGALRIGATVAGIYPTNSPLAVHHVLEISESCVCFVDDAYQMRKVHAVKSRLPNLHAVIQLNGPFDDFVDQEDGYYRWSDLYAMHFSSTSILRKQLKLREREVAANECALLIFTSGTTGMPKAVMLSHDSVVYSSRAAIALIQNVNVGEESLVSYLPLSHIAAQFFDIFMAMELGSLVYFADRNSLKGTLLKTFEYARPTSIFGVPRIFEKIQEKYMQLENDSSAIWKFIMENARNCMEQYHLNRMQGKKSFFLSLKSSLASKLTNKVKTALGLERSKYLFIGGAPIAYELKRFFLGLDMVLIDTFGMSEASGGILFAHDPPNLQVTGKPIEGLEIKINNSDSVGIGEVCLRGRSIFMGYLNDPEKTKEALTEDGWLLSGDSGYIDEQGNLYVSGRIKELIITSGGENIAPALIEANIKKELSCISNAVVVGDNRKYLTVLLTFKTEMDAITGYPKDKLLPEVIEWLYSLGLHYTLLSELLNIKMPEDWENFEPNTLEIKPDDRVVKAIQSGIKRANKHSISNAHRVQYFTILPHDFSIPTKEMGPTLKLCRAFIVSKYAQLIDKMYKN